MLGRQLVSWDKSRPAKLSNYQAALADNRKNQNDSLLWLVDLSFILTFASAATRMAVGRVLSSLSLGSLYQVTLWVIMLGPVFLYAILLRRFVFRRSLVVFIVVFLLFLGTLVVHPEYQEWFTRETYGVEFFLYAPERGVLWMFLMVEACGSFDRVWRNIKTSSILLIPYYSFTAYRAQAEGGWWGFDANGDLIQRSYDLDFGYGMGLIILVAVIALLQKDSKKPWTKLLWLIVAIMGLIGLIAFGSRGAFLCLVVGIVMAAVLVAAYAIVRRQIAVVFLAVIVAIGFYLLYRNFTQLVSALNIYLTSRGIESRTLQGLAAGQILDDNGRGVIYSLVTEAFRQKPLLGYGVFGDRPIVGPSFIWGYSHNIFLEIFISFGLLFGSAIVLSLLIGCIRYFVKASDRTQTQLLLLVMAMCARLLVSDTFWGNPFFWVMLALLLVQPEWSANANCQNSKIQKRRTLCEVSD